ncbi:MAG: carboxypeptidase regulatory-like domain-containing protein, partial [Phycisphaerae bacterium]|nr:carboxypeptidase regulatory-like domain-containing protein [Phycisphaerae bacterium]
KALETPQQPAAKLTDSQSPNFGIGNLIVVWSVGVFIMLVRMFRALASTARLRRSAVDIQDGPVKELFDKLCRQMNITQKIRFASTMVLKHPGVIGFFRPVLLVPVSMLTELPADYLQAIIAHELAHIRRYDYLVNFCQMLIEAIFFFNPAVWWISRQIRIEREVCCDTAGIETTGKPIQYAKILFDQLTRSAQPPQTAMTAAITGFSDDTSSTSAERVKRIIYRNHKPQMRIGWIKLALLIAVASLSILALWKAADITVNLAAKMLTPKQRIEKMKEIAETYSGEFRPSVETDKFTLSGKVTTYDGKSVPREDRSVVIHAYDPRTSNTIHIDHDNDGTFKHTVRCMQKVFVTATAKGYAMGMSEIYSPDPNEVIDNVNIVLQAGFDGKVKVIDEQGNPIAAAILDKKYIRKDLDGWSSFGNSDKVTSDENGIATFEHSAAKLTMINVRAEGYQKIDNAEHTLTENKTTVITLQKGLEVSGVVVAKQTGKPIAGAKLRLIHKERPGHGWGYGFNGQGTEAVTDTDGKFTLTTLAEGFKYTYIIEAEGYNLSVLPKIEYGDTDLKVEMLPELYIKGKVIGDLKKLSRSYSSELRKSVPSLWFNSYFKNSQYDGADQYGDIPVEIRDGVGYFTLKNILGDGITILGNDPKNRMIIDLEGKSVDDIVFDLDAKNQLPDIPNRPMILTFKSPQGYPPVEGKARLSYMTQKVYDSNQRRWSALDIVIENGVAKVDFPVPAYMQLSDTGGIKGFWIEPESGRTDEFVEASDQPYERTIIAEPAGSIYGRILDEDGKLIKYADMKLLLVKRPDKYVDHPNYHSIRMKLTHFRDATVQTGKYSTPALVLGGTYAVIAQNKNTWIVSKPIELTSENPIQQVDLKLGKTSQIKGRVLMPDKTPAKNIEIGMEISARYSDEGSYGVSGHKIKTDSDGRFLYDGINPQKPLKYNLQIKVPGFQPMGVEVEPGKDKTYELKKGITFTGKVIDDKTGWPVPDAWVNLSCNDGNYLARYINSDRETDKNGNFKFTTLDNKKYSLSVGGAEIVNPKSHNAFINAGKDESMILRVNLQDWSKLKPRKPDTED